MDMDRPKCSCHSEPMHKAGQNGWQCAVKNRARVNANNAKDPKAHLTRVKRWKQSNPEKVRSQYFRRQYGIEVEDYNRMLDEQDEVCAICSAPAEGERPLVVDHNHITGEVRGLLCDSCNRGIGLLKDSAILCLRAEEYLRDRDSDPTRYGY